MASRMMSSEAELCVLNDTCKSDSDKGKEFFLENFIENVFENRGKLIVMYNAGFLGGLFGLRVSENKYYDE